MSFFTKIFNRKCNKKIENTLSEYKVSSNEINDKRKQKLDRLQKVQEQYFQRLSELSTKQRWDFAFTLLNDFNTHLPFDLLKDIIPDIPRIHDSTLDSDIIEIMLEDIEIAKYEYGFTINELGEFADLLAKNSELSLEQSSDVLKHVLEIELSNYSSSLDEFKRFLTYLDSLFEKINLK
ncbi:hypothetical protein R0J89_07710 [Psychrobacter sp. SIMBA_152]